MSQYRIDRAVEIGPLKGWRVRWDERCIQSHIEKYGSQRPELKQKDFFENLIPKALAGPTYIYPSVRKIGGIRMPVKSKRVLYHEMIDSRFLLNGKEIRYYVRVVIKKAKWKNAYIITAHKTQTINESTICKPLQSF